MDLKIFRMGLTCLGDMPEDEVPQSFAFRDDLEKVGWVGETVVGGLIVMETFYKDEAKTDMVVKAEYTYGTDPITGAINSQSGVITHYCVDGDDDHEPFTYTRNLSSRQQMKLIQKRRQTITQFVKGAVLQLLVATGMAPDDAFTAGGEFIIKYDHQLHLFEVAGSPSFVTAMTTASEEWLDSLVPGTPITIRDYIISEMSK